MIDCLCFGWRKRRKYEKQDFHGFNDKCQSPKTPDVRHGMFFITIDGSRLVHIMSLKYGVLMDYFGIHMFIVYICWDFAEANELKPNIESTFNPPIAKDASFNDHDRTRVFNYRELATATRNFHPDSFHGEGGFGSVYKGKLLGTNEVCAFY